MTAPAQTILELADLLDKPFHLIPVHQYASLFKQAATALRAAALSTSAAPADGRKALIEQCAKIAEGPLYREVYRGRAGHNWWHTKQRSIDAQYGNGRHDAAAGIRALASKPEEGTK